MLFSISELMEINNSYGEVIQMTTNEKKHQLSDVMEMNTIFREVMENKKKSHASQNSAGPMHTIV